MERLGLQFSEPAAQWTQALPLGNGHIGVMLHGGVHQEILSLNDDKLWSGHERPSTREGFAKNLQTVRRLLADDRRGQAQACIEQCLLGRFSQVYLPLGELRIQFSGEDDTAYSRRLDFFTAAAEVTAGKAGNRVCRSCFCSFTDDVMVYRIQSEEPMVLQWSLTSRLPHHITASGNRMMMQVKAPDDIVIGDVYYFFGEGNRISYDHPQKGMDAVAMLEIETDGKLACGQITGATQTTLYYTSATTYRLQDPAKHCAQTLAAAAQLGYQALRQRHEKDFGDLYGRVKLVLGEDVCPDTAAFFGTDRVTGPMVATLFQYGRYLLLSSSREGTLPANLQGIWNQDLIPAWWSSYTLNINLEMNYWPAWKTNLSECTEPLLSFMELLCRQGEAAAAAYGMRGAVVSHQTDAWGLALPVGRVEAPIRDSASWGMWNMALPWLTTQLLDGWRYTGDRQFLKRTFSLMEKCADFLDDYLVEREGRLYTVPSTSPENIYCSEQGERLAVCQSCAMDIGILFEFYTAYAEAAAVLGEADAEACAKRNLGKLPPYQTANGRLLEWDGDFKEEDPGHRHFSMLYGIYPGTHLLHQLPAQARAAFTRRLAHGGGGTGWSAAWAIALAARFGDSELAESLIQKLVSEELHPNLFGAHPPHFFQIDANFGFTAAVCELLVQDHGGVLRLLPALPPAWQSGRVMGLVVRGGHTLSLQWENGEITAKICAARDEVLTIELPKNAGENAAVQSYKLAVETGKCYTFSGGPV